MRLMLPLIFYITVSPFIAYYLLVGGRIDSYIRRKRGEITRFFSSIFNLSNFSSKLLSSSLYVGEMVLAAILIQTLYLANFVVPTGSMIPSIMPGDRYLADVVTYRFRDPKRGEVIAFRDPMSNTRFCKRVVGLPGERIRIGDDNFVYIDGDKYCNGIKYFQDTRESMSLIGFEEWVIPKAGDTIELEFIEISSYDENLNPLMLDIWELREMIGLYGSKFKLEDFGSIATSQKIKSQDEFRKLVAEKVKNNGKNGTYYFSRIESIRAYVNGEHVTGIILDRKTLQKLMKGEKVVVDEDYYFCLGDNSLNSDDSRSRGFIRRSDIIGRIVFRWWPIERIGFFK